MPPTRSSARTSSAAIWRSLAGGGLQVASTDVDADDPAAIAGSGRVLVVGSGFIGTAAAMGLARRRARVTVLSRRPNDLRLPAEVRVIEGDATDARCVDAAVREADAVLYCAGAARPAESDLDPLRDLQETVPPVLTVLEALRRTGGRLLVVSSGGAVYGEPSVLPVPETHPVEPVSAYGILKATVERFTQLYRSQHGVDATALRCSNVYGPGQVPFASQGVIASLLACAASGQPFTCFGDGTAVRDYIHVHDVVEIVDLLLRRPSLPPVVNIGTGVGTTLHELIRLVEVTTGRSLNLVEGPQRPSDLHSVVLDITRLRRLVEASPRSVGTGIADTWEQVRRLAGAVQ